jgi:hypothetical protein
MGRQLPNDTRVLHASTSLVWWFLSASHTWTLPLLARPSITAEAVSRSSNRTPCSVVLLPRRRAGAKLEFSTAPSGTNLRTESEATGGQQRQPKEHPPSRPPVAPRSRAGENRQTNGQPWQLAAWPGAGSRSAKRKIWQPAPEQSSSAATKQANSERCPGAQRRGADSLKNGGGEPHGSPGFVAGQACANKRAAGLRECRSLWPQRRGHWI